MASGCPFGKEWEKNLHNIKQYDLYAAYVNISQLQVSMGRVGVNVGISWRFFKRLSNYRYHKSCTVWNLSHRCQKWYIVHDFGQKLSKTVYCLRLRTKFFKSSVLCTILNKSRQKSCAVYDFEPKMSKVVCCVRFWTKVVKSRVLCTILNKICQK